MRKRFPSSGAAFLALLIATGAPAQQNEQKAAVDVSGVWELTSETPRGTVSRKLTLKQDGDSLTGNLESPMGTVPIQNGSVKGNEIRFTVVRTRGERSLETVYTGTVDGDTARGTLESRRGDVEWTAKRVEG
jgi:hypothetical protein